MILTARTSRMTLNWKMRDFDFDGEFEEDSDFEE